MIGQFRVMVLGKHGLQCGNNGLCSVLVRKHPIFLFHLLFEIALTVAIFKITISLLFQSCELQLHKSLREAFPIVQL